MPSKSKGATIHDVATGQHAPSFEGLLDAVPDALFGVDPEGVIQFVNRQAESLFGYDRDDLIGLPIETLVPETLRAVHRVQREEHAAAPHARTMGSDLDLRGRRRDGTQLSVDISLSALDAADAPLVIAAVRDMSHYRRTGAQSRRLDRLLVIVEPSDDAIIGTTPDRGVTESRLAFEAACSMLEASLDSVVSISPEGKITDANEATLTLTGVPRDKLIGTSFSDYFTDPEKAVQVHQRVFSTGMAVGYHLTLHHHNGRETLAEFLYDASVHRDAGGRVLGVCAAARDVTPQSQAFGAARSMMEASLDSLVAISPEGKITDANQATLKLTGVPRDKLIGTSFSDYFTDPTKAEEVYQRVLAHGEAVDYPLTLRHRDGHEILTEVRYNASVYRDDEGKVLGVFAAARDVTHEVQAQRRVAEQQAREWERLAELERFQRLTVGRELKMIELKKEIEHLRQTRHAEPGVSSHAEPGGFTQAERDESGHAEEGNIGEE